MKGRKKGCSLPSTFILLLVCFTACKTTDLDDNEEEYVLGIDVLISSGRIREKFQVCSSGRCWKYTNSVKLSKSTAVPWKIKTGKDSKPYNGAALPPLKLGHSVCAMKAVEGPCKAIHIRYYFNVQSRECEMFEYGGCHGNENNFLTLEECQKKCVVTELPQKMMLTKIKKEKPNFCFSEKDPGICRGYFSRYFYNKETKICEVFKYGGCLGNQNNFRTLEECQTTCQDSSNLLPIIPAEEHPNTGNSSSPEQNPNQFPGILVNLLPTAPNDKSNTLNNSSPKEDRKQFPIFFEQPPVPSLCMAPMDKGLCRAKELRFFYNYSTGRCRPFSYSGCGGNENNFTSRKSCLRICKKGFNKRKGERRLIKIKKKKKKPVSQGSGRGNNS